MRLLLLSAFLCSSSLPAQLVEVPFVACGATGQIGWEPSSQPQNSGIRLPARQAAQLAYFSAQEGIGLLGPKGWHCLGLIGSSGPILIVSPHELRQAFENDRTAEIERGPIVLWAFRSAHTSGRNEVCELIAPYFPQHIGFVNRVREIFDLPEDHFPSAPFPADVWSRKGVNTIIYRTPPQAEGLGTKLILKPSDLAIEGYVQIVEAQYPPNKTPQVDGAVLLATRLPESLRPLAPLILKPVKPYASNKQKPKPAPQTPGSRSTPSPSRLP